MPFLVPNEVLNKLGEHSYGVKEKVKLAFWFDGGLKITGNEATLSLNLKDPDLLILCTLVRKRHRRFEGLCGRLQVATFVSSKWQ